MTDTTRRRFLQGLAGAAGLAAAGAATKPALAAESLLSPRYHAIPVIRHQGSAVNITYWGSFSGELGDAEQAVVKKFNDSQKDVVVDYQFQGSYEDTAQKLTAGLQARQVPDVTILSDVWWFSFYLNRVLLPLDEFMQKHNVPADDYVDSLIGEGTRKGQTYWIPFARSTPIFYYNRDAWAEAGLPDRGPKNWDEYQEWMPKLVKKDGANTTRYAIAHSGAASYVAWIYQTTLWEFGGKYSDPDFTMHFTDPENTAASDLYRHTVQQGWASVPQDVNTEFRTGVTASIIGSTANLKGHIDVSKFQVGTAFLPEGPAGFGCCTGGSGLAVINQQGGSKEKQEAAFKYIAFATSPDITTFWSQSTGYMPVRKSAIDGPAMKDFYQGNPQFLTAVQQLPLTKPQDAARVFVRNGDQIIGKGLERILIQQEDIPTVWKDIQDTMDKAAEGVSRQLRQVER